jgi:NAD(P)-dependent dehydrogenase (short-subunit alcohol dehydrogenase family)
MVKDKVVVITGAGRGIGREIALLMVKYGAKVVVNDLGCSEGGEGEDRKVADEVVDEIKKAGGEAAANYNSVASMDGASGIIETAVKNFGRIDVLVNNAGILRDRMIFNMSEEEWNTVLDVNLKGAFATIRAAAPVMRRQGSGRIINFTSTSALIGNRGQANYGAAKLGVVGLTKNVALDLAKYNVTVNCIAPFAWTRLIGTMPTDDPGLKRRVELLKKMSPRHITPLVIFLASDAAREVTGQIFGVRGKEIFLFSQIRPMRSMFSTDDWTPEKVAEIFVPAVKHMFYPLHSSPDIFPYDPLV